jgi:hypothetical protein
VSKSVYIVTQGSYSDYHIAAVFSNKSMAEAWVALKQGNARFSDPYEIEKWPLDATVDVGLVAHGRRNWRCYLWDSGGSWLSPGVIQVEATDDQVGDVVHDPTGRNAHWSVNVEATDAKHAIKIAAEKFSQARAELAGIA